MGGPLSKLNRIHEGPSLGFLMKTIFPLDEQMLIQRRKRSISRRRNHRDNFMQINTLSLLDKLKSNK